MPASAAPPPRPLVEFVRSLGRAEAALDLGCGDGRLTRFLDAASVTGADVSAVALGRAHAQLPEATLVQVGLDERLPFEDGSFDLALCAETIEHVRDVQLLLSELRRVLRPGGRLALTTPAHSRRTALRVLLRGWEREFPPLSPHLRFFTARSLAGLLDDLGFDVSSLRADGGTLLALASRA